MAIIIKGDTGIVKCAASNKKEEGDLYIGDALHYNLAMFFAEEGDEQIVKGGVRGLYEEVKTEKKLHRTCRFYVEREDGGYCEKFDCQIFCADGEPERYKCWEGS